MDKEYENKPHLPFVSCTTIRSIDLIVRQCPHTLYNCLFCHIVTLSYCFYQSLKYNKKKSFIVCCNAEQYIVDVVNKFFSWLFHSWSRYTNDDGTTNANIHALCYQISNEKPFDVPNIRRWWYFNIFFFDLAHFPRPINDNLEYDDEANNVLFLACLCLFMQKFMRRKKIHSHRSRYGWLRFFLLLFPRWKKKLEFE